jgi:uncharacterized protein
MLNMEYEWDPRKAAQNLRKHKVNFADTVAVFEDTLAMTLKDDYPAEERFNTIGTDILGRILVVCWTYRGRKIRVISARKATPAERRQYSEGI